MVCEHYRLLGFKQTIYDQTSISHRIPHRVWACRLCIGIAAYKLFFK